MPCNNPECQCDDGRALRRAAEEAAAAALTAAAAEVVVNPEAPAEAPAETDPPCERCGEPADDCTCRECHRCRNMFAEEDYHEPCDRCHNCCYCSSCENCGDRNPDVNLCNRCEYCNDCCGCAYCEGCGENTDPDSFHSDCDRCEDCCECGSGAEDDEGETGSGAYGAPLFFSPPNGVVFHRGSPCAALPSSRFVAVEIEVASAGRGAHRSDTPESGPHLTTAALRWSFGVVRDGSLGSYGFEINTSPASGTAFVEQVNDICGILAANGAAVDRTCGLHLHLDARRLTIAELTRFVRVANLLYNGIKLIVPRSRHDSSYARPYSDWERQILPTVAKRPAAERVRALSGIVHTGTDTVLDRSDVESYRRDKWHNSRYKWVNVHSWFYRGTIEIRIHSGTTSAKKIVMWAALWSHILDRACRMTDADVDTIAATQTPWRALLGFATSEEHLRYLADRRKKFDPGYSTEWDPAYAAALTTLNTPVKLSLKTIVITDTE